MILILNKNKIKVSLIIAKIMSKSNLILFVIKFSQLLIRLVNYLKYNRKKLFLKFKVQQIEVDINIKEKFNHYIHIGLRKNLCQIIIIFNYKVKIERDLKVVEFNYKNSSSRNDISRILVFNNIMLIFTFCYNYQDTCSYFWHLDNMLYKF